MPSRARGRRFARPSLDDLPGVSNVDVDVPPALWPSTERAESALALRDEPLSLMLGDFVDNTVADNAVAAVVVIVVVVVAVELLGGGLVDVGGTAT